MKPNLTFSKFPLLLIVMLLIVFIGTSCQKSFNEVPSSNNNANQQKLDVTNNAVEASISDEENFNMVMGNGEYADGSNALNAVAHTISNASASGRTITYSPSKNVYPHTKIIDYGLGITDANGVTRSGKVIITYYAPLEITSGKYSLTTYNNYYVNGVQIQGHVKVNKMKNNSGKTVYAHIIHRTVSDANGSIKKFEGVSRWTVIDWQGGTDNAYQITEYTVGNETYNGEETSNFITSIDKANPAIKPFTCKRVQGGLIAKIHLTHVAPGTSNDLNEYLDYGNGDCDDAATLSVNGGESQVVTLPLRFWPLNL